jgi:hypothetical protein
MVNEQLGLSTQQDAKAKDMITGSGVNKKELLCYHTCESMLPYDAVLLSSHPCLGAVEAIQRNTYSPQGTRTILAGMSLHLHTQPMRASRTCQSSVKTRYKILCQHFVSHNVTVLNIIPKM